MRTLNVRLVLHLVVPFLVLLPLGAMLQYYIALLPIRTVLDRDLESMAIAVGSTIELGSDGSPTSATLAKLDHTRPDALIAAVVDSAGRLVAGDPRLLVALPHARIGGTVFADVVGDPSLRIALRGVDCGPRGPCQVRVAEAREARDTLEVQLLFGTLAGVGALLLVIGTVMWFSARDSLAPVRDLRRQMESRSLSDLAPVEMDDPPDELIPVIDAINELFARVRDAAQANQAFVAEASHQLRTPLAQLTTQLELALQQRRDAASDRSTLLSLQRSVDRISRLAQQLLSLARSEASARPALPFTPIDLKELALQAGSNWVPRAAQAGVDLGFELAAAPVNGNAQLLSELLGNLIDNALRYGARHVTVRTEVRAAECELQVEDDGPGIPVQDRDTVFQRFVRGSNATGEGSGLGLAIVRQVAELHGGRVSLAEARSGGLRIVIVLPRAVGAST